MGKSTHTQCKIRGFCVLKLDSYCIGALGLKYGQNVTFVFDATAVQIIWGSTRHVDFFFFAHHVFKSPKDTGGDFGSDP